jgi:hypothetical protein
MMVPLVCGLILTAVFYIRYGPVIDASSMSIWLPVADKDLVFYIDVRALRRDKLLAIFAGKKVTEEPEYQAFVSVSGFDYRTDLDAVMVAYQADQAFLTVAGRFDWKTLKDFTEAHNGTCRNGFCQMPTSQPNRIISFRPMRTNVIAMAFSPDPWAALRVARRSEPPAIEFPPHPVWIISRPGFLQNNALLPSGTQSFAQALQGAERVTVSFNRQGEQLEALLDARCRSSEDAAALLKQLTGLTDVLRNYNAQVNQKPNPADLSGILTAGRFEQRNTRVFGSWPIAKDFLDAVTGGSL